MLILTDARHERNSNLSLLVRMSPSVGQTLLLPYSRGDTWTRALSDPLVYYYVISKKT